jgi:hypothetical protein
MGETERKELEATAGKVKEGKTNYFQLPRQGLTAPNNVKLSVKEELEITWDTAYAADAPLDRYEVYHNDELVTSVPHTPQISKEPFSFSTGVKNGTYRVVTVDSAGNRARGDLLQV